MLQLKREVIVPQLRPLSRAVEIRSDDRRAKRSVAAIGLAVSAAAFGYSMRCNDDRTPIAVPAPAVHHAAMVQTLEWHPVPLASTGQTLEMGITTGAENTVIGYRRTAVPGCESSMQQPTLACVGLHFDGCHWICGYGEHGHRVFP